MKLMKSNYNIYHNNYYFYIEHIKPFGTKLTKAGKEMRIIL